ncbi:hypothetical protein PCANC_07518 [Puccinia coronata f. sp. avenae]|uniref:Uncharacterized protein n=1 Tax=Puccinia coronata f. sp. avenae TaxID=200324 RepID=A0A2N5VSL8_9BASI|nr:hypothetical protein PCANC_07518 [Puccinia coronata f. sp. avenae]
MSQLPLVFPDGSIFLALQRPDPFISLSQAHQPSHAPFPVSFSEGHTQSLHFFLLTPNHSTTTPFRSYLLYQLFRSVPFQLFRSVPYPNCSAPSRTGPTFRALYVSLLVQLPQCMTTQKAAPPNSLLPPSDPEAIIRSANAKRRRATRPILGDDNQTTDGADSATAKDWFKAVLKVQHTAIAQAQEDRQQAIEDRRVDRRLLMNAVQTNSDRINRLEELLLTMNMKNEARYPGTTPKYRLNTWEKPGIPGTGPL